MSVSRAVGIATVRNRIKRRIREIFRHMKSELMGTDIFLIVRPAAGTADFDHLRCELKELISKKIR